MQILLVIPAWNRISNQLSNYTGQETRLTTTQQLVAARLTKLHRILCKKSKRGKLLGVHVEVLLEIQLDTKNTISYNFVVCELARNQTVCKRQLANGVINTLLHDYLLNASMQMFL